MEIIALILIILMISLGTILEKMTTDQLLILIGMVFIFTLINNWIKRNRTTSPIEKEEDTDDVN